MLLPTDWLDRNLTEIACLAPLQEIVLDIFEEKSVRVFIKREDLLHPLIGGNKIYKLHGYLSHYLQTDNNAPIVSFGGAYSNHILALATVGNMMGIRTIGVIRGEESAELSDTLLDAKAQGMHLHFVSRSEYRQRHQPDMLRRLEKQYGNIFTIPEGGGGTTGALGMISLAEGITLRADFKPEYIFHACGTGASLAGLIAGFSRQPVGGIYTYGVPVLKGYTALGSDIESLIGALGASSQCWRLLEDYHWGGYAKFPDALASFVQGFEEKTGIPLDPVYTAKEIWAIVDQVSHDRFPPGANIVAVHSGGLQGRRGYGLSFE
ncbi:MAG: pyridoxal-phosphate dependent enzyme [Agarilytica sp.]